MLRPATYAPLLKGADFVVHSMGILLEADYKGVLTGKESPISGLRKAFSPDKAAAASPNPLERAAADTGGEKEDLRPPRESREQLTYEVMNRDSAVAAAREAARTGNAKAFVYISAADGFPLLPARYITTKREAESIIASEFPRMRGIFVRPPFMYDGSRSLTIPLAALAGAGTIFNKVTQGVFGGLLGAGGVKPVKVDTVAEAVVEAFDDETVKGPVEVQEIEELAAKSWRKNML